MALAVNNLSTNAGDIRDAGSIPGQEDPLEEDTAGESHGQNSLAGYGPQGRTELDTTKAT